MGILYLVPTPVGNLEDMTLRAIRILKEVDVILAEDTRTSGLLLKHFEVKNRLCSHHKFNEHQTADAFAARMAAGERMALVSDAGRPASVCREISKVHEESVRGTLEELHAHFEANDPRGEFVIVVGGYDAPRGKNRESRRSRDEENDDAE